MRRRTFLFSVPILFWACFFIFGQMAQASNNIFYYDDFSTGQATGWQEKIASGAIWQVENGKYHLNIAESRVRAKSIYHNGFNWKNYIFF